jgi:uncharacterized NAD(P)/FAD-binding protein YdhS
MRMPIPRIAIIGGGFTGAMVAVHLARQAPGPAIIDVIEPLPSLGGGVAYSATDPAHRINVPAARMTVFGDDPTQFDRWLREGDTLRADAAALWSDGSAFPQRSVFGRYIAGLVEAARADRPDVRITHHRARVTDIGVGRQGYGLSLDNGASLPADMVVLAVSHPPPSVPARLAPALAEGAPIVANPWMPGALDGIAADASVMVVGTGLTAADAIATLERRGHRGPILAVSRRGLMSRGHAFGDIAKRNFFETAVPPRTALGLCAAIRGQVRSAAAEGAPWQAVFDDVRGNARRLWAALPVPERRRVVRHLRPFWDVHRFRVAPQVEAAIARLRAAGQFHSMAAHLQDVTWDGQTITVRLRRNRRAETLVRQADAMIVTTGPGHGSALTVNPALAALNRQGLLTPDKVGLGLEVDADGHAVGRTGIARPDLFIAGPLARGRVGELMGLPQVSEHAEAVARAVALSLGVSGKTAIEASAKAGLTCAAHATILFP